MTKPQNKFEERILKEFRESDMCFDDWIIKGKRCLHTNRDVIQEVEQFLLKAIREAREDEGKKLLSLTADCSGYRRGSAKFIACRAYNESLLSVVNGKGHKFTNSH